MGENGEERGNENLLLIMTWTPDVLYADSDCWNITISADVYTCLQVEQTAGLPGLCGTFLSSLRFGCDLSLLFIFAGAGILVLPCVFMCLLHGVKFRPPYCQTRPISRNRSFLIHFTERYLQFPLFQRTLETEGNFYNRTGYKVNMTLTPGGC